LTALLDDLVNAEENGLHPDSCREVRKALERGANKASSLPDGTFFRKSIYRDMERFVEAYQAWNDPIGSDRATTLKRRKLLGKLRERRNKLARRIRRNMQVLEEELDKEFVRAQYEALNDLVRSLPSHFGELAKVVHKLMGSIR
jgi:hypothetical protein